MDKFKVHDYDPMLPDIGLHCAVGITVYIHNLKFLTWQLNFLIKEWFNCKTRMPRTVKCRPTVAYWVQIDGINIATELIQDTT